MALRPQGQLEERLAALRKAVELDPDHVVAWSNLGEALARAGQLEESLAA